MAIDLTKNLRQRCHVNTNDEGDRFVGVKADTEDASIYFPIGYRLPDDDDDLRADVHNLFGVLAAFMKEDKVIEASKFEAPRTVDFPMHAYLKVIRDFLRTGRYYIEVDPHYRTDTKGNASWPKTVREQRAFVQKNGSLVFTNMTVRSVTPNANKQITQIHRYCVYEAFEKMGWIYVPFMPSEPGPHPSVKESIYILGKKLASTHNDVEQELFSAMLDMLVYIDNRTQEKQYFFGTDFFERVWEKMIDKAFGTEDKDQFFPRTRWILDCGRIKDKRPLIPDSIMLYNEKCYILDAKLYRYGWDADPDHLPNGSDINKQITYGEYIAKKKWYANDALYNAFLMPYNREDNPFNISGNIENIGEAIGQWKDNDHYFYERVQGIVIDTRFLMYNYLSMSFQQKDELASSIEKVRTRAKIVPPVI